MHKALIVLASNLLIVSSAIAAPPGRPIPVGVRGAPPAKTPPAKAPPPAATPAPAAPAPDTARVCAARRSVLETEQKRYDGYASDVAGISAEIAQLTRRLDELKRQKDEADKSFTTAQRRVKAIEDMYKKDCSASEDCTSYEVQASALDKQTDGIEVELDAVRTDIKTNREAIAKLETSIAPLQREYTDKKCNNLVPGETEQVVIDRCMAIFSDWNRLQAELNRQNSRVPDLKSRYDRLFTELKALEGRAKGYEGYLSKNCSSSPETAKMKGYTARRERAQNVQQELDALVGDITKLRGVKITITPQ